MQLRYESLLPVQVPLVLLTDRLKKVARNDQYGNMLFWLTFCIIGQPTAMIMYYHDWVLANRPDWVEQVTSRALSYGPCLAVST